MNHHELSQRIPWELIFLIVDGMDAARPSLCCNGSHGSWRRKDIDAAMEARLKQDGLGQSLLRRHDNELPLSKLVFCMDHPLQVGTYLEIAGIHRDPNMRINQWTRNDLYQVGDLDMTWCRVLFVIDGIAVYEAVLPRSGHMRFPVARLPLPYLLDFVTIESFLNPRIKRQHEMEKAWQEGFGPCARYFVDSENDEDENLNEDEDDHDEMDDV